MHDELKKLFHATPGSDGTMMDMALKVIPDRLRPGSHIRVVAPAQSLAMFPEPTLAIANDRFEGLGVRLSFGQHVQTLDRFRSAPIADRVADLHDAFADPDVDGVLTVVGGYNCNQLVPYLDWDLIATNPKIFCGYSDITALSCAITTMTGMVTYSGPHYSSFGMRDHFETTLRWFTEALFSDDPVEAGPAESWTDDNWFHDQDARVVRPNEGHWTLTPGVVEGRLIGGNLCTLNLLQGTPWMPDLSNAVVFIEDDLESSVKTFDRDLTSLTQQPNFDSVRALLIGRFQSQTDMDRETLAAIVASKRELAGVPIIANVDFGHTDPLLTLPVGGDVTIAVNETGPTITLSD